MAQGIVVVRNEDISYKEMRAIAVDVMNVLSRCVQEDFDDYAIMRNFVARATECTQSILALRGLVSITMQAYWQGTLRSYLLWQPISTWGKRLIGSGDTLIYAMRKI